MLLLIWEWLLWIGPWILAIGRGIIATAAVVAELGALVAALYLIYAFLVLLFDPRGAPRIQQMLANITAGGFHLFKPIFAALSGEVAGVVTGITEAIKTDGATAAAPLIDAFQGLADTALSAQRQALMGIGKSEPGNALDGASQAFKVAFGAGLSSAGVAAAFEALFPEKLNTLNGTAPMLGKLAGFDEVAGEVLGPLYENAFGRSLRYLYQSTFKPDLPSEGDAVTWHGRGLLTDDQLRTIFHFSGLKSEYETAYIDSAYRPISAFILVRIFEAGIFDHDQLVQLMTFAGLRPQDQALIEQYAAFTAPAAERAQALSALLTAAERGTVDETTVEEELANFEIPSSAVYYVQKTIGYRRLEQLAELYRKSVSEAYKTGQISDADYVPHLEAIGINQADAEAHYAIDSIMVRGKALTAAAREAAALGKQRMRAEVNAAIAAFRAG
jgi:hypothetical protein